MEYITTKEAAERLGLSIPHVKKLLRDGDIKGTKIGRDWLVKANTLNYQRKRRPKGYKEG